MLVVVLWEISSCRTLGFPALFVCESMKATPERLRSNQRCSCKTIHSHKFHCIPLAECSFVNETVATDGDDVEIWGC